MNLPISTATINSDDSVSFDDLKEALQCLGADPLAEWMKEQGFDPEDDCLLILPSSINLDWGPMGPPKYVFFSNILDSPILMNGVTSKNLKLFT